MWSTPAVWKQYNKMVVFHFFPINSPLKYILFSLASNLPQTNLMHKICHKIYEWALNLPKHNLNSWSLPQKLWMSFKSATNNLNAWNRPQILRWYFERMVQKLLLLIQMKRMIWRWKEYLMSRYIGHPSDGSRFLAKVLRSLDRLETWKLK